MRISDRSSDMCSSDLNPQSPIPNPQPPIPHPHSPIPNPQSPTPNPGSSPMATVFIEALEVEALIGIYDWERRIRQPLLFDIEMQFDNRVPAASDDIADTLNYKAVSKRVIAYVSQSDFGLVETLAERVAAIVDRKSTRLNSSH